MSKKPNIRKNLIILINQFEYRVSLSLSISLQKHVSYIKCSILYIRKTVRLLLNKNRRENE